MKLTHMLIALFALGLVACGGSSEAAEEPATEIASGDETQYSEPATEEAPVEEAAPAEEGATEGEGGEIEN